MSEQVGNKTELHDPLLDGLADEAKQRIDALWFNLRGYREEVARLRRHIDRVYWSIPAGNAATDVERAILDIIEDIGGPFDRSPLEESHA